MSILSVGLVDNQPVTAFGIAHLLASRGGLNVIAQGRTADDFLLIARDPAPDFLIIDPCISNNPVEMIRDVSARCAEVKVIVFSSTLSIEQAAQTLEAGARAFVSKTGPLDELIDAIQTVRSGETFVSQSFASRVISALRNATVRKLATQAIRLSVREDQVIHLLMRGKTNKEIAALLSISEKTVKHYMTVLMQKLNARNRLEVVIAAQQMPQHSATRVSQDRAASEAAKPVYVN